MKKQFYRHCIFALAFFVSAPLLAQNSAGDTDAGNNKPTGPDTTKGSPQRHSSRKPEKKPPAGRISLAFCKECHNSNLLIYDFSCKKLYYSSDGQFADPVDDLKKIKVRYGKELKFIAINVNRYVYDVVFTIDDVSFGSEPPALFTNLFLGQGDFMDGLAKLAKPGGLEFSEYPWKALETALIVFKQKYDELTDSYIKAYSDCETFECCEKIQKKKFSDYSRELLELKSVYHATMAEIHNFSIQAETDLNSANTTLEKMRSDYRKAAGLDEEIKKLKEDPKVDKQKLAEKQRERNAIKLTDTTQTFNEKTLAETAIKTNTQAKETIENIWTGFSKPTDEQLMRMVLFNNNLSKENFHYTAPPMYPQGDRLEFALKIAPRDTVNSIVTKWHSKPLDRDSTSFAVTVTKKSFVSFSSGVFIGFGDKFRDQTYQWQAQPNAENVITDSAKYKLVSTGNASPPIGFTALAHVGKKIAPGFSMAIAVGAGISIEDKPRPVYLSGLSFMFGNKQQFNISAGMACMQVEKIKTDLYPNMNSTIYDSKPATIEFKKGLEAGGFVSVTYTIFTPGSRRGITSGQ
jgi:hypothetical protein